MIKIYPTINSIIGATKDRLDVRRLKNRRLEGIDKHFYDCLVKESGPSTNNPIKMWKNWKKAYLAKLKKFTMVHNIRTLTNPKKKYF